MVSSWVRLVGIPNNLGKGTLLRLTGVACEGVENQFITYYCIVRLLVLYGLYCGFVWLRSVYALQPNKGRIIKMKKKKKKKNVSNQVMALRLYNELNVTRILHILSLKWQKNCKMIGITQNKFQDD